MGRVSSPITARLEPGRRLAVRVKEEMRNDNVVLIAAGLAFFGMLALGPAMVAVVSVYGLVASPSDVVHQFEAFSGNMPEDVRQLLEEQLTEIASASSSQLGLQAALGIVVALWAASSGTKHLIVALRTIYDTDDGRSVVRLRLTALAATAAALVFLVLAVALLAGAPTWIEANVSEAVGKLLGLVRWPLLAVAMVVALSTLYRRVADRDGRRGRWVSWGAVVAAVVWLGGSAAFSFYSSRFGNYHRTYGAMAEVVIALVWLYITALAVLLGAEINAQLEVGTTADGETSST